ncbi:hypothetical protein [Limnobacter sp.]|uniref:hypothetical protein n=1 Tax=Limnobacter sp. TaxID=2003368 RepID=UPI0025B85435|nr:hypothetical protein [Limnobacter sp.]
MDPCPDHPNGKMIWTRSTLDLLKRLRAEAIERGDDTFDFTTNLISDEGVVQTTAPVDVTFAKYVIEYYDKLLR